MRDGAYAKEKVQKSRETYKLAPLVIGGPMFKKIGLLLAACGALWAEKPLVVGTTSGYAPFVSLNEKGEYEGFDVDVARALSAKLGRPLVIKDCGSMPGLMMALKQGKVDLLIWSISITEKRKEAMQMVHYQGDPLNTLPLLFWQEIPEEIHSLQDLARDPKRVICVEAGTFQEDALRKIPGLNLRFIDKISDALLELRYGKAFCAAIDPSLVSRFQEQAPELRVRALPLPAEDHVEGNGICLRKEEEELVAQVRRAIEELTAEKKIAELETKWQLN